MRTPEQMQRWTDLVAMVRNQLVLARTRVSAARRPWAATTRPATPQQVRRALARVIPQLGTPAPAPVALQDSVDPFGRGLEGE